MKTIKEIKTKNESGNASMCIRFVDGSEYSHSITQQELLKLKGCDDSFSKDGLAEYLVAKYLYRDRHSVVGTYHYINYKKEICALPSGHCCGQCKFFHQTGVYYSEISLGNPDVNSDPYPVGTCEKHGFGPRLSAYSSADGRGCGWQIADWCRLDDRKLTEKEENELREIWTD